MTSVFRPLPCPFCGAENPNIDIVAGETIKTRVWCWKCLAEGPHCKSDKEAIDAWDVAFKKIALVPNNLVP